MDVAQACNVKNVYISGGEEYNTTKRHVSAPLFVKKFALSEEIKALRIEIIAVGFYVIFLNGEDITKGLLRPYISNPDQVVYKDVYIIEGSRLEEAENTLSVLLGNGFSNSNDNGIWNFESASYRAAPKFSLNAFSGEVLLFGTPGDFAVADSPITFDDLRCGERYDARKEGKYIFRQPTVAPPPKGIIRETEAEPIKTFEEYPAEKIFESGDGFIYDFGRVNSGVCRLETVGTCGQKISLKYGETVIDGKLDLRNISFGERSETDYIQHDEYICKEGRQSYTPRFTYHGFRYVFVEGIKKEQATEELLTFVAVRSDIKSSGSFICDDKTVNGIQSCVRASDLSNFHYFPTDCPQREKNGWTGDVLLSAEQFLYNFDCVNSLKEWLFQVRTAQREDGKIPAIVPTFDWGYSGCGGPAWDGVIIELPEKLYKFTGDKQILRDNLKAISSYLDYLADLRNPQGLIAECLGDWCETGSFNEWEYSTPLEVSDTLVSIYLCERAQFIAAQTEDNGLDKKAGKLLKELKLSFRNKYINGGKLTVQTQTALALALSVNLLKDGEYASAIEDLLSLIHANGDRFKVGVIGAKFLFGVLSGCGETQLALKLIKNRDFPGYGYWLDRGATTLWEAFHELDDSRDGLVRKDGARMLSLNHHFWGSVSAWFYKYVAGINVVDGERIILSPCITDELGFVRAEYRNAHGKIAVEINNADGVTIKINNEGFTGSVMIKGYEAECHGQISLKDGESVYKFKKVGL